MTMTESSIDIDNVTQQARQGSVAAIIQILNDRLSNYGVRTRAIFVQGILQLLCEADTTDRLEKDSLVQHIRQILCSLRPRHIRRVKINSRLVNEQQLLWLDAIKHDPDGQLLWSEDITLPRPNPIQVLIEDFSSSSQKSDRIDVKSGISRKNRDRHQFAWGILGGAGISLVILLIGWIAYDRFGRVDVSSVSGAQLSGTESATSEVSTSSSSSATTTSLSDDSNPITQDQGDSSVPLSGEQSSANINNERANLDSFAQAVLTAEEAVASGQRATTSAEWLEIASQWQRASDLMGQVSSDDARYETAQNRLVLYQAHREEALHQANLHQVQ